MSWLAQRWRTQWNAKRNVNCRIQGIIRFLNANGAVGIFLAARLFQCLWYINIFLEPYLNACVCDYQEEDLYRDSSLVVHNTLYRVVALHALMVIALAVQIYVDVSGDFSRVVWRWWVQPDLFVCVAHSRMCRGHCFVVLYFLSSLSATYIRCVFHYTPIYVWRWWWRGELVAMNDWFFSDIRGGCIQTEAPLRYGDINEFYLSFSLVGFHHGEGRGWPIIQVSKVFLHICGGRVRQSSPIFSLVRWGVSTHIYASMFVVTGEPSLETTDARIRMRNRYIIIGIVP